MWDGTATFTLSSNRRYRLVQSRLVRKERYAGIILEIRAWPNMGQLGRELVFGGRDFYFTSTYYGDVYGFNLVQGAQDFYTNIGTAKQAATARDGTLYVPTGLRLILHKKRRVPVVFLW